MCGIVGIAFTKSSSRLSDIDLMTDQLKHRGPDDRGTWVSGEQGVALGHRRLSIIDLTSNGHQPMFSENGRYIMIFNGELYNFQSLQRELKAAGVIFSGHSDSQVLIESISHWGLDGALRKIRGMFAIALWDNNEKKIHLIRDRFGEKPLYYYWKDGELVFGSELKVLHQAKWINLEIDRSALGDYVSFGYVPAPQSIYQNVKKVQPGCVASFDSFGNRQETCYWSSEEEALTRVGGVHASYGENLERAGALLSEVVEEQMIADVPVGSFLSGGIDSSLVTALMQKESTSPIQTFCIGFEESTFDEAPFAKRVANYLGTKHTEFYINAEKALHTVTGMANVYDEPLGDYSQIPTLLVCQLASEKVKVCLSGDGGDELFGGYNHYFMAHKVQAITRMLPKFTHKCIGAFLRNISGQRAEKMANMLDQGAEIESIINSFRASHPMSKSLVIGGSVIGQKQIEFLSKDLFSTFMIQDTLNYLPDSILAKVDRAAMYNSLETRIPLLDHRVFQFAWSLPHQHKVHDKAGKSILRDLLYRYIPRELVDRPKSGFTIPVASWLRGPLKSWASDLLSEGRIESQGLFDHSLLSRLWEQHLSGRYDWKNILWNVLMFQEWYDRWHKV